MLILTIIQFHHFSEVKEDLDILKQMQFYFNSKYSLLNRISNKLKSLIFLNNFLRNLGDKFQIKIYSFKELAYIFKIR